MRKIVRAIPHDDTGLSREEEEEEEEEETWERATCARHLISSVGADTTKVARPPAAPASQILERDWDGAEGVESGSSRVRLRL